MEQQGLDEAEGKKEAEKKEYTTPPEKAKLLLELDFKETEGKQGLWYKKIDDDTVFFWSFQKTKNGASWCNRNKIKLSESLKKQMVEYTYIRQEIVTDDQKKDTKPKKQKTGIPADIPKSDEKAIVPAGKQKFIRGTERDLIRLMDEKIQLDSIIAASEDPNKLGEGMLWHELTFKTKGGGVRKSVEPSAELVDMIALDMGQITTKVVEFGTNIIVNPNTNKKYATYYCVVQATDGISGTSGLGAAEQIIDFGDIENRGRTFARTNAIRKAERNGKERLIPIPRKAMVSAVRKKLQEHANKHSKS